MREPSVPPATAGVGGGEGASRKPRLMVLVAHFLPGDRAGGPTQSIAGLVERLGAEFDIRVLTSDHDLGETTPFANIRRGEWSSVGDARVYYLPPGFRGLWRLATLLRRTEYDVLYVNSLFSRRFAIYPMMLWRLGWTRRVPAVVAPRGELDPGARAIKWWRKTAYLWVTLRLGLYDGVRWQASSTWEKEAIIAVVGGNELVEVASPIGTRPADRSEALRVVVATDLARARRPATSVKRVPKNRGELRMVFVSRISRKKNLDGAIRMLRGLSGRVRFDVYGPLEDASYWRECGKEIEQLPAGITVEYKGRLRHEEVADVFRRAELFFFPTRAENFGHVIREAFLEGCPVLVSDRTPWRNLESAGAGWDIPLEDEGRFREILQSCVDRDAEAHGRLVASTLAFGAWLEADQSAVDEHRQLFREALRDVREERAP